MGTSINPFRPSPLEGEGRVRGVDSHRNHPHPFLLPLREKVKSNNKQAFLGSVMSKP